MRHPLLSDCYWERSTDNGKIIANEFISTHKRASELQSSPRTVGSNPRAAISGYGTNSSQDVDPAATQRRSFHGVAKLSRCQDHSESVVRRVPEAAVDPVVEGMCRYRFGAAVADAAC
jgi:hypothetical protein